jgi:spore germination cell wall hydrolase CwlJ-like protein
MAPVPQPVMAKVALKSAALIAAPVEADVTSAMPNGQDGPTDPAPAPLTDGKTDQSFEPQHITHVTSLAALVAAHRNAQAQDAEDNCLAVAIYFESKGEPLAGQLAVAQVMLNRTRSGRFPETLCGVVKQAGQFSFVRRGALPSVNAGSAAWHTALAIAEIARAELWQPVVGRAMFFHAKRVAPHWHATQVASLGHHIFYR